ncbi:hypothetical protein OOK31_01965 [Streptomyces sp. NBC_00249]|uniref:trypsin-like peptidase domain-containing protein n=1 Tax=Streptomyces sp. NBC_00249 TaxID=2975690 RepID=UPI0022576F97|nr:trypsin-like peptidase domain-containing protein [Streptomyces sp. NBC_00249]MCX5192668.1 hypothetical protein [Streptomyces sp. NBC_00249]
MRRTSTVAAAVAAAVLLLPGGPLPVAEPGSAEAAPGRWTAREAASFWTPQRMASAVPVPDPPAPQAPVAAPAPSAPPAAGDSPTPTPAPAPAAVPVPGAGPVPGAVPAPGAVPVPGGVAAPDPAPPAPSTAPTPAEAAAPVPTAPADGAAPATPAAPVDPVDPVDPTPAVVPSSPVDPTPAVVPSSPAVPVATPTGSVPASPPVVPVPVPRPARPVVVAPAPAGVGRDFDGMPVVGRMFVMKGAGAYFCTASVVSSPGRNLVLSAAHCLLGTDTRQVAFVPQYTRADPQPYGMFPVLRDAAGRSKVWIHQRYRTEGAERAATLDVAFAQVGPDADGDPVESVVGGNRLLTGAAFTHPQITLIGYPASAARPRICVNRTTKFTSTDANSPGSFLRIDCTGYPGGTSGGPFLARYDAATGTGDVVGVIGGWKTGGPTADTSYSSYFGAEIRKLYRTAVAGARTA